MFYKPKDDHFPIKFNRDEFIKAMKDMVEFIHFYRDQFEIIKKYHKEIKAAAYFYEDDPISEKIRNMNQKIRQLKNR